MEDASNSSRGRRAVGSLLIVLLLAFALYQVANITREEEATTSATVISNGPTAIPTAPLSVQTFVPRRRCPDRVGRFQPWLEMDSLWNTTEVKVRPRFGEGETVLNTQEFAANIPVDTSSLLQRSQRHVILTILHLAAAENLNELS